MAAKKKAAKKVIVKKTAAKKPVVRAARTVVSTAVAAALLGAGTVLVELANAAKVTAKKGEELDKYTERVLNGVAELDDNGFNALSAPAQTWYNAAAVALNDGKPLPEPTAVKGSTPAAPAEAPEPKATTKGGKKSTGPKENKSVKPTKDKAAATPRTEGTAHQIRALVVKQPEITFDKVKAKLGIEGDTGSYNWNRWNESRSVMKLAKEQYGIGA